ncbi:MAG: glycosyltransferase family 1 protein [Solirubrobacterales bacterium]
MSLPRRIGLNLLYIVPGKVGGTEIYARELIGELAAKRPDTEFIAYCGVEAAGPLEAQGWPANVRVKRLPVRCSIKPLRILAEQLLLPLAAAKDGIRLLHSLGTTGVAFSRGRRVVTVHDLIFHHFPDTFPGPAQKGLELLVPLGARRSRRVLADSQATKDDLIETYAIAAEKIDVVYLGLGFREPDRITPAEQLRARFELDDRPVVLCVAAALAHKNIPRLFEAFAGLKASPEPLLVVVGHAGLEMDNLKSLAADLGIGERVRFTGWIETEELEGLYRLATCFAYPTLREGFGLPVLEAMQRGTPVACSNTSSVREVAGEAAVTFDPTDVEAIRAAIDSLLADQDLRAQMIERGRPRAAEFTWQRCADETLAAYEAALR